MCPHDKREIEVKEFVNSFSKEFFLKFGVTPSVFYSFKKLKFNVTLENIVDTVNEVLKNDLEYEPEHTIQMRSRKRYLVLHRQCAFRIALQAGYGPSIIGTACKINHATVIHGNKVVQGLLEGRDKQTAFILRSIENELEKRYGTERDVQSHHGPGVDSKPVLHNM